MCLQNVMCLKTLSGEGALKACVFLLPPLPLQALAQPSEQVGPCSSQLCRKWN